MPRYPLSNNVKGACWKILSCAAFASIQAIVRYLTRAEHSTTVALSVNGVLFFQSLFSVLCLLPLLYKNKWHSFATQHLNWHFLKVLCAVIGLSLFYLSVKYLPLAQSIALHFLSPVIAMIGARYLLQEKITFFCFSVLLLSLIGAMLILYPEFLRMQHLSVAWIVLLPVGAAIALAASKLVTRHLGVLQEHPKTITTYLLFFTLPVSFIFALFDWVTPHASQWLWLLLLGILNVFAHYSFSSAYTNASISFLTPFGYCKFLFGTLLGYAFFNEFPQNIISIIGMACILLSAVMMQYTKEIKKLD